MMVSRSLVALACNLTITSISATPFVHAVDPTPTPVPTAIPTAIPTQTPTPATTQSPTQTPTTSPTTAFPRTGENPLDHFFSIAAIVAGASLLAGWIYFKKESAIIISN